MFERFRRWAVPCAILAGGAFIASGMFLLAYPASYEYVDDIRSHSGWTLYVFEGMHAIGVFGLLVALAGIHHDQAQQSGRLGKAGFWIAFVGSVLLIAATVLGMGSMAIRGEHQVLDGILDDGALLGWLLGFPLFGIATLRARVFPSWFGILVLGWVPLYIIASVVAGYPLGFATVGIVWLMIAFGLRSAPGSAPVRRAATA